MSDNTWWVKKYSKMKGTTQNNFNGQDGRVVFPQIAFLQVAFRQVA